MTRQIKFRAWDEQEKQWFRFPFVIDSIGRIYREYIGGGKLERNIILVQFTGLLDKNGKEIYEGDIVKTVFWNKGCNPFFVEQEFIGKIEYKSENGAYFEITEGDYTGAGQIPLEWACHKNDEWRIYGEIIGNIYENESLLSAKE